MSTIRKFEEINAIIQSRLSVFIAKTKDCSVCNPVSQRLKQQMSVFPSINVHEIYIEDFPAFRGQFMVFTVPTILIFQNGREVHRESRFIDWERLNEVIETIL